MNSSSSQDSERNLVQLDLYDTHAFVALERQGLRYICILYRTLLIKDQQQSTNSRTIFARCKALNNHAYRQYWNVYLCISLGEMPIFEMSSNLFFGRYSNVSQVTRAEQRVLRWPVLLHSSEGSSYIL